MSLFLHCFTDSSFHWFIASSIHWFIASFNQLCMDSVNVMSLAFETSALARAGHYLVYQYNIVSTYMYMCLFI